MKEQIKLFLEDESASLSPWISVILLTMLTILIFIIVWPWARKTINESNRRVGEHLNAIIGDPTTTTGKTTG